MGFFRRKFRGYRAGVRVETHRAAAEDLRKRDPELYRQILDTAADGGEAEAAAQRDPDAYVALVLSESGFSSEPEAEDFRQEGDFRTVLAEGGRVASQHGVDLVDLANAIIEDLAAPDGEQRFYPSDELRAFASVQFATAARIQDPVLEQAFAASSADPPSEGALEHLGEVAQRVLDEQGLAPAVDALVAIISADDIGAALDT